MSTGKITHDMKYSIMSTDNCTDNYHENNSDSEKQNAYPGDRQWVG